MQIIISPAKQMNNESDLPHETLPMFIDEAERILQTMKEKDDQELQKLWKTNDKITGEALDRMKTTNVKKNLQPALLAYKGIQYQYMIPGAFTNEQWDYVNRHLRILSGMYGVLRPMDGIVPYRLEMQAKLKLDSAKDLYAFWGERLQEAIYQETDVVLNLASEEYAKCIRPKTSDKRKFIDCIFGVYDKNGEVKVKATWAKMARGEMVRFMATHQCNDLEQLKKFDGLDYHYSEKESRANCLVFIKK